MNKPLVSIITVCYNAAQVLESTILSILSQKYEDIEYIIIDGGSNDGTIDIINNYSDKISYWISEPDSGIYEAMNKGITMSHGEWLCFMNAGDFFVNSKVVSDVVSYLSEDISVFHGNIVKVYKNHKEVGHQLNKENIDIVDFFYGTIDHQAAFIKKSMFEKYGKYDTSFQLAADWFFFMKVIGLNRERCRYVNMDIAFFQMDGKSTKHSNEYEREKTLALQKEFGVYYSYLKELSEYRLSSLIGYLFKIRMYLRKKGVLKHLRTFFSIKFSVR